MINYDVLWYILIYCDVLGTVQKLHHPGAREGGVSQKIILAYVGGGGVKQKMMDDGDVKGGEGGRIIVPNLLAKHPQDMNHL